MGAMAGSITVVSLSDGSKRYRARYRDASGQQHEKRCKRRVDAQAWLDAATASIVAGSHVAPRAGRTTVGEVATRWREIHLGHLKPSTVTRYEGLLRLQVLPTWETRRLEDVRTADVRKWVANLHASGLSASSVRAAYRVLSLVLDLAVEDNRLPRNPAAGVKLPRAHRDEPRFLSRDQLETLARAAGEDGDVVRFLAATGLRFGEMVGLKVGRVDLLRRRVTVAEAVTQVGGVLRPGTPKTHQRREVAIPRHLVEALARRCEGKNADDYVFTSPQGGPIRLDNWRRRVFNPAVRVAGLGGVSPHDLRHTAASLAVASGAHVKAVQKMLGHASAAMTLDVYSGLFEDDLERLADHMDRAHEDHVSRASVGTVWAPGEVADLDERRTSR
jgi:integrase